MPWIDGYDWGTNFGIFCVLPLMFLALPLVFGIVSAFYFQVLLYQVSPIVAESVFCMDFENGQTCLSYDPHDPISFAFCSLSRLEISTFFGLISRIFRLIRSALLDRKDISIHGEAEYTQSAG
jgi:hypothetical protein